MINTQEDQIWRILHIDDDEDDHVIVKAMLNEAHSRVVKIEWAATLQEARSRLAEGAYNAVLVDYDLGIETGLELIHELAAAGYEPPLILLTGRGNYEVDVEAMRAGATLYLTKSEINPLLLERSIRYAIERKQSEASLRQSEEQLSTVAERFKAVLENSLDAAYRRNLQTDRYDYISPVIEQILGFTPNEMTEMSTEEAKALVHPDDLARFEAALSQAVQQGSGKLEYRFRCKRGYYRWVADHVNVSKDADGRVLFMTGIVRDVTDQRRAEQALSESEQRFQLASRAVSGVLYDWNIGRTEVYQSDGLEQVVGYRPGEEPGGSKDWWPRHIHPDDYPEVKTRLQAALAGQTDSISYEYRIRHRDGHWVHILDQGYIVRDEQGQAQRVVGLCTDISERVHFEQALRESENKHRRLAQELEIERATLEAAIESLPIGVGIANAEGRILSMNKIAQKQHGYPSKAEQSAQTLSNPEQFELWTMDGRKLSYEEWPIARAQRSEFVQDFVVRLKNVIRESEAVVSYTSIPVYSSQGELSLVVYLIEDLGETEQSRNPSVSSA